ncbi:MAG: DUF456 domain-containing protein [Elusimicrobia bacterium]|nr:DUF456 domain-containing protein [Elusimicrobiota bacterium]
MKTPRLALLALLLLAPAARAAFPTWPVIEEGPRSWARVFFTVGKDAKTLRCRYNECKPENKGVSNLYVIAPAGKATPTKVTIYKAVPRNKWNPKYYTDGPYEKVPEVINANAQPYSSELSNFKLDNTGKNLVVVQGDKKYPATTDVNERQFNSYDQLKVAPPTKMADDAVKPTTPGKPGGKPGNGGSTTPRAGTWWCNKTTGVKLEVKKGKHAPKGYEKLASKDSECKKGGAATDPVVAKPGADASLALIDEVETRWLTKPQAAAYSEARTAAKDDAARKAADAKSRGLVEAQIRPEALAAYKAAAALPPAEAPAKIKDAIGKVEMWGGDIKSVVAPFQEKADPATAKLLEVQLSKADWDDLKKKPEALQAYTASRVSANGASGDGTAFDKNYLDPVALRLGTEAALKALGRTPVVGAKPENGDALVPLLTDAEKKLLTPSELATYQSIFDSAKDPKEKDANLQKEARRLRDLIASENRGKSPAYAVPGDLDAFNKLPEWQKRKFCAERAATAGGLAGDARAPGLGGSSAKAKGQLDESAAAAAASGNTTTSGDASGSGWAADACKPYNTAPVVTTPGTRPSVGTTVPTPIAVDKETDAKKKSEWLTQDLLVSAAKGGMVGLLVGSLFGPVGLIAGPIIGAALFYGLTKIMG